uniref:RING-type E3 ubiquitin transferase n=1 Tax=Steinernema glaseri TaxID=37863 RepID=A0A1I7ZEF3_9BILA
MGSAWSRLSQIARTAPTEPEADGDVDTVPEVEGSRVRRSGRSGQTVSNVLFGLHFLMGGERYDLTKPGSFLFGENCDLELLGNKPVQFPCTRHPVADPVQTLNSLINVRRDSVKLNKIQINDHSEDKGETVSKLAYRLEFILDCDCDCYVQIHFCAKEIVSGRNVQIASRHPAMKSSEKYYFRVGASQLFDRFVFHPENYDISMLHYESGQVFPVVIEVRTAEYGMPEQVQTTLATVEQSTDHSHTLMLKPLKQKLIVDGVTYLLQEIFGIENKDYDSSAVDENGSECIICMSDVRDTVILPCRHLCICNGCAETLRYKLNNCPICRSPFRALLQLKTMRVVTLASVSDDSTHHNKAQTKYETSTLVEALNGPVNHVPSCVSPMSSATVGDTVTTVNIPSDNLSADRVSNLRASLGKSNKARTAKIQQVLTMKPKAPTDDESQEHIEMQSATSFKQGRTRSDVSPEEEVVGVHSVEVECEQPDDPPPDNYSTCLSSTPHSPSALPSHENHNAHATLVVVESVDLPNASK